MKERTAEIILLDVLKVCEENLDMLNQSLEFLDYQDRLSWAKKNFDISDMMTSTSGAEDAWVLQHMVHQEFGIDHPRIVFLNHNEYLPETLEQIWEMAAAGYPIDIYDADIQLENSAQLTAKEKKQALMQLAFKGCLLWIKGGNRDNSEEGRSEMKILEYKDGTYRLNLLADMTIEERERYKKEHGLQSNLVHFDPAKLDGAVCGIENLGRNSQRNFF